MKRILQTVLTASFIAAALWSCKSDPATNPERPKLADDVQWMYDQLCKSYYWNDAVKSATPPANVEYDEFLDKLLSTLKGAQDDTENPPTIDGGYYSDGSRYIYSYVDRTEAATRAEGISLTFGFGFQTFWLDKVKGLYCFLITWTQPGGPAEKAELKRGMWIMQYNGKDIAYNDYVDFFNQVHFMDGGTSMRVTEESGTEYSLTAKAMLIDPIICNKVVESPEKGVKTAYLVYNDFETGENGEFDAGLRSAFAEFKAAGAQNLVLDLRYNPGGYVSCCRILTSLAADVNSGMTFAKLQYNKDVTANNPEVIKFRSENNSLKLKKIYVLATEESASASEMVISSLRGVDIEVVHIGGQTEGKNVGMDRIPSGNKTIVFDGYSYEMWPITFKIKNAKDFCDYAGGFEPDYLIDEFRNRNTDGIFELGDPQEELLKAALTLIDGGKPVVDTRTRAQDADRPANPLRDIRGGGAKVVRNDEGELML